MLIHYSIDRNRKSDSETETLSYKNPLSRRDFLLTVAENLDYSSIAEQSLPYGRKVS